MLQIGKYVPAHNGREALIQREFYEQGYIVKDEAAYRSHPERVCYVPELSDTPYTTTCSRCAMDRKRWRGCASIA